MQHHLHLLMMPAILFSSAATVLTNVIVDWKWGTIVISSVNAIISFLLALVNYFKLDAASEAHKTSSHQYDKLQSSVEFTSGSVLLFRDISTNNYNHSKLSDTISSAEDMIEKNIRVNNEFYVCPVFNQAIADNKKIRTFNTENMWGLGTPEDLNYYIKNYNQK